MGSRETAMESRGEGRVRAPGFVWLSIVVGFFLPLSGIGLHGFIGRRRGI